MANNDNWLRRSVMRHYKKNGETSPNLRKNENIPPTDPLAYFKRRNRKSILPPGSLNHLLQQYEEEARRELKADKSVTQNNRFSTNIKPGMRQSIVKKPLKRLTDDAGTRKILQPVWKKPQIPVRSSNNSGYLQNKSFNYRPSTQGTFRYNLQPAVRIKTEPPVRVQMTETPVVKVEVKEPVLKSALRIRRSLSESSLISFHDGFKKLQETSHPKFVKKVNFDMTDVTLDPLLTSSEDNTITCSNLSLNGTYQPTAPANHKSNTFAMNNLKSDSSLDIPSSDYKFSDAESQTDDISETESNENLLSEEKLKLVKKQSKLLKDLQNCINELENVNRSILKIDMKTQKKQNCKECKLDVIMEENTSQDDEHDDSFEKIEAELGITKLSKENKVTGNRNVGKNDETKGGYLTRNKAKNIYQELQRSYNLDSPVNDCSSLLSTPGKTPNSARSKRKRLSLRLQSQVEQLFS